MDLFKIEPVELPGSEVWNDMWGWGRTLEIAFPNQETDAFATCVSYNDSGPTDTQKIADLVCDEVGENEEADWVWTVKFGDGSTWRMTGGCDYTGWDCQSWNEWEQL